MTAAIIIAAYLAIGAFIAGLTRADDAAAAMATTLLYPFFPVMIVGAWVREGVHRLMRKT